jgi:Mycothiol maleylpyruvate isomerase N-terminal domain
MSGYDDHVNTLERELNGLLEVFRGLGPEQWETETLLVPFDEDRPHWTLFELAGHFDISIGLAHMLVADPQPEGQPGRDRVSFFIFPRSEVAPVVYDYAYTMVEGKTPGDMPGVLEATFAKVIERARSNPAGLIGSGYYALMELGEFIPSRVVETVVHGLDLTDPLGMDPIATPDAITTTAAILDELLARRTVGTRPADLADDMEWIRAASGRRPAGEHPDPRLPLIG